MLERDDDICHLISIDIANATRIRSLRFGEMIRPERVLGSCREDLDVALVEDRAPRLSRAHEEFRDTVPIKISERIQARCE